MTIPPPIVAPHRRGHDIPPERILLLALLPIGDSLLTTPTIGALRARYPRAHITALVYSRTAALMRCVPAIDEVAVLPLGPDWAGVAPLTHALRSLRAARFDVAIDFTSPAYQAIGRACGIPIQTSLKVDPLWWLLPGPHRRWRATHASEHYYDAARELGLPPWAVVEHRLTLRVPASACAGADRFLCQQGGRHEGRPLVGIHAGGRWLDGLKQWPPERFAVLAQRLQRRWNARIVLLGGPEEEAPARALAGEAGGDIIVAAGALPLLASLALVARCDLFVGNDSSLLHAAAALGTPYVGNFGPTCPANYAPVAARPGQGMLALPPQPCRVPRYFVGGSTIWRRPCCQGTCAALRSLAVDTVLAQAEALLTPRRTATHEQEQEPDCGSDTPAGTVARQTA